jgi:HlyD family secretion protein
MIAKKPVLIAAAAAIALALLSWLIWRDTRSDTGTLLSLNGEVEIRQADLGFNVDGPIEAILVDEGDSVKAGQLLARLEQAPYRLAVANAEATLKNAEEILRQYRNGFRPQEIEQSRANVAAAEANYQNALLNDRRTQDLVGRQFVSQSDSDTARALRETAEAQLRQAKADLSLKLEGTRAETVAQAEASAAAARASRDLQLYRLSRTLLAAPNDGIVLTRIREVGAIVAATAPVLTLSVIDPVWIRAYVDEPHIGWLTAGRPVSVHTDALGGKIYRGRIGYVSPTAEFTPKTVETQELRTSLVYRVRVIVDNPDGSLRQGMPATVVVDGKAGEKK